VDSILSALKDLLNNVKNLTLLGLVAALGFVFLLWPRRTSMLLMMSA